MLKDCMCVFPSASPELTSPSAKKKLEHETAQCIIYPWAAALGVVVVAAAVVFAAIVVMEDFRTPITDITMEQITLPKVLICSWHCRGFIYMDNSGHSLCLVIRVPNAVCGHRDEAVRQCCVSPLL